MFFQKVVKSARESTVIFVNLSVSDVFRDVTSFSYPLQNEILCSLSFMALIQNSSQNLEFVSLCFFGGGGPWGGGGGWRFGAAWVGGWGWPCVSCCL